MFGIKQGVWDAVVLIARALFLQILQISIFFKQIRG